MFRPTLADKSQPSVPLILRGKKKTQHYRQHSLVQDSPSSDIRRSLDYNLNHLFQQIKQRKKTVQPNRRHSFMQKPAYQLNEELVRQYIKFVYQEYSIPDPLTDITVVQPKQQRWTTQKKKNFKNINQSSTNRKAVHLKQSFLIQMFSPEHNSDKKENQLSYMHGRSTQMSSPPKKERQRQLLQIKQSYRYCFVCEQPILEANIEAHQKIRCPQFSNLYTMPISQLRQILLRKINRIKNDIESKLFHDGRPNKKLAPDFSNLSQNTQNYINSINHCLQNNKTNAFSQPGILGQKNQIKMQFSQVMRSFDDQYFTLNSELKKFQWFVNMFFNLQKKINTPLYDTLKRDIDPYKESRRMSLAH